tara:strand:+ start:383 stop:640 length:258 start_codon:yes stop_codon:yes gene_type:complete
LIEKGIFRKFGKWILKDSRNPKIETNRPTHTIILSILIHSFIVLKIENRITENIKKLADCITPFILVILPQKLFIVFKPNIEEKI